MKPAPAKDATAAVWRALSADLSRFLERRVRDREAAADLLQDVFVRIHAGLPSLRRPERVRAWVFRMARNALADHLRATGAATLGLEHEPVDTTAADGDGTAGDAGWLLAFVDALPPRLRDAVRLAEIDGRSGAEVAAELGIGLEAAKARIRRGRAALRRALESCCHFEFDRRGGLLAMHPRLRGCGCACGCGCGKESCGQHSVHHSQTP